jgi:hypothetical protein
MALTTAVEMELKNAGLIAEFNSKRAIWLDMAKEAYGYTCSTMVGSPKQDDVSPHLAWALETRSDFIRIKDTKKLRAKYWFRRFADLIIDRCWKELTADTTPQEDSRG